jgi:hypothetical protein
MQRKSDLAATVVLLIVVYFVSREFRREMRSPILTMAKKSESDIVTLWSRTASRTSSQSSPPSWQRESCPRFRRTVRLPSLRLLMLSPMTRKIVDRVEKFFQA